jgi:hypothetical protein
LPKNHRIMLKKLMEYSQQRSASKLTFQIRKI